MVSIKDYVTSTSLPRGIKTLVETDACLEFVLRNRVSIDKFRPIAGRHSSYRLVAYRLVATLDCEIMEWDGGKWYPDSFHVPDVGKNVEYRKKSRLWVFPERLRDFSDVDQLGLVMQIYDFLVAAVEEHEFDYEIRCFNSGGRSMTRVSS